MVCVIVNLGCEFSRERVDRSNSPFMRPDTAKRWGYGSTTRFVQVLLATLRTPRRVKRPQMSTADKNHCATVKDRPPVQPRLGVSQRGRRYHSTRQVCGLSEAEEGRITFLRREGGIESMCNRVAPRLFPYAPRPYFFGSMIRSVSLTRRPRVIFCLRPEGQSTST